MSDGFYGGSGQYSQPQGNQQYGQDTGDPFSQFSAAPAPADSNPFGSGYGDSGSNYSGGGGNYDEGNPFISEDTGNFYDDVPQTQNYSAPQGQYQNYGDEPYTLGGADDNSQYAVADSHATPEKLAQTMDLPQSTGYAKEVDLTNYAFGQGAVINETKKKKRKRDKREKSWYQLGYYKKLFNFDTDEILRRIFTASNPLNYPNFWQETKDSPDLYVPIWGTTTLWFLLVCCGTMGAYFANDNCTSELQYDKIGWGALNMYGYVFFLPFLWYILCYFWLDGISLRYVDHIYIYGYSLLPFIPTMFINIMPFPAIRWVPFILAYILSTYFLGSNYFRLFETQMGKGGFILFFMGLFGLILPLIFQLYFFDAC